MIQALHKVRFEDFEFCSQSELSKEEIELVYSTYKELAGSNSYQGEVPSETFGRGSVIKLTLNSMPCIMRLYRRGGMLSRFNKSLFQARQFEKTRSYQEFCVLNELYLAGVKVSKPIAALVCNYKFGFYRAAIVTQEITQAENFLHLIEDRNDLVLSVSHAYLAGIEARKCLECGILHTDLHPGNVLTSRGMSYLIDFDKAKRFDSSEYNSSLKYLLERWNRSVKKRVVGNIQATELIKAFEKGLS